MMTIAIALAAPPGVLVRAQSPTTGTLDACALLTDAEVLAATGAVAITAAEPVSSFAAAGYASGCARQLEPPAGLAPNATLTLDYGVQEPGGRALYDAQLAVMPDPTHVGGLGDDAVRGLSGEWYAVKGDATVALGYLGIGVFDTGLRHSDLAARALAWRAMARLAGGTRSPDTTGPVCVLSTQELAELTGVPFASVSAGDLNCLYRGDAPSGAHALDIRLEDPSPGSTDATLDLARMGSGADTTVADLPAWSSDEALWVDLGARLLVIQPIFSFADAMPRVQAVTTRVAEAVIERLAPAVADPTPEPTPVPDTDLASLFPTELRGSPVTAQTIVGAEVERQVGDPTRLAAIQAILTEQGRDMADLSLGLADLFDAAGRHGSIIAIRLRGADAEAFGIPLLLALQGMPDLPIERTPATIAGKEVVVLTVPGVDPARAFHAYAHGDIAWFLQAKACTTYTPEQGCEAEAVDQPLLEEVLEQLP